MWQEGVAGGGGVGGQDIIKNINESTGFRKNFFFYGDRIQVICQFVCADKYLYPRPRVL